MTVSLLTEVKWEWAMLIHVLGWVNVSVRDQLWDVPKLEFLCVTNFACMKLNICFTGDHNFELKCDYPIWDCYLKHIPNPMFPLSHTP